MKDGVQQESWTQNDHHPRVNSEMTRYHSIIIFIITLLPFTGCKENHFYSLPFGQAEASIY